MSAELWAITMCGGLQVPFMSGQVSRELVHLVVANLAFHANDEALVWVSDRTQAKELGKSRGSVQLARQCLKRDGWLVDTGRRAQRGVKKFSLVIPENAIQTDLKGKRVLLGAEIGQVGSGTNFEIPSPPVSGLASGLASGSGSGLASGSGSGLASGSITQSQKEIIREQSETMTRLRDSRPRPAVNFEELAACNPRMAPLIRLAERNAGLSRHGGKLDDNFR